VLKEKAGDHIAYFQGLDKDLAKARAALVGAEDPLFSFPDDIPDGKGEDTALQMLVDAAALQSGHPGNKNASLFFFVVVLF
jgi:hypothetical protein